MNGRKLARFTGETGTILKIIKEPDSGSRAMVLTDMSAKELEVFSSFINLFGGGGCSVQDRLFRGGGINERG